ncbi:hypothetical protein TcasGA2_TC009087 [Tribolium castaneum]|uniref:Uncharacterized protein n=1 Tax=Tribolium castaneum TaxID=7070 RepID=D6WP95_TRICA|nr:hypothetical protein TcasGA2_TC009087 [Tribolium castaneum]
MITHCHSNSRRHPETLLTRDRTGKTPLHYCSTSDNICAAQAADLIVMAAPDLVESHDDDGFTPLHLAVIAGNMPLVTFLLANKADVNAMDNEKHTVVHWATVCGETSALRAVLAAGAPVSTPDVHGGYPLHYAAQMCGGDKDSNLGFQVLQTLLTHSDIVVSVEDDDGRQPLLWAASAGSAKAVLALVRAGANVEAPDKDGLTALHCAASRGHTDCIDSLLTLCGATPDVIDSNGCTALHYAVTLGHADATALLLAHGADPNRQDRKGRTPAHCGCAKGQFETVKMIGAHGANLWLRNARGDLPLHEAAASGRRDLVRWLLDMRPSQVNARNNDGRCPLHLAALNDNADMCKILLDAGAQINPILRTSKNTFMTPLDCALQRGFRSTAKYLQLHGGVPATRLGDIRQGHTTPGVNFQIKDDVTFWGDTSSDSERENGEVTKHNRRIQRKKLSYKYEKKKASISTGSDLENNKLMSSKLESGKSAKRRLGEKNQRAKTAGRTDSATSIDLPKHATRKTPSGRFDYHNEIIINGKTEINIHQTKEIHITPDEENLDQIPTKLSNEVAEKVSEVSVDKDKRPKSAKHAKVKEKVEKSGGKEDSARIKKQKVERPTSKQKIEEKAIKNENNLKIEAEQKKLTDQQSLKSNTSEDQEEHKSLVVEAAVHEPPKQDVEKSEADKVSQTDIVEKESKIVQTSELEKDQVEENVQEVKAAETQVREIVEKVELKKNEKVIEQLQEKITDESKEKGVSVEKEKDLDKKSDETVDQTTKEEKSVEESKDENDLKEVETTQEFEIVDENEKGGKVVTEQKLEIVEEKEKSLEKPEDEEKQVIEEKSSEEKNVEGESKNAEETEHVTQKKEDETIVSKKEEFEEKTDKEERSNAAETLDDKPPGNGEDVSAKSETEKNLDEKAKEKKLKKQKMKKRSERKKRQNGEQAYEIIYKTMAADESDDLTLERLSDRDNKTKTAKREKLRPQKTISGSKSSQEEYSSASETESSTSTSATVKEHKSFRILNDKEAEEIENLKPKPRKISQKTQNKQRSRSEEDNKKIKSDKIKRSKIPTPLGKSQLSKSDKYLNVPERKIKSSMESRVPSLPNINETKDRVKEHPRCESNMSAPLLESIYSDNDKASASDLEEEPSESAFKRKKVKRKAKMREARSAGSDYESSNVIDSGFEPSPRSSRIPKWKNMSERGVNMTSVTQSIQSNIRRYHLERKIFQHLLDLKRIQIRAGQHNEAILVKRAIDAYHQSCASTVGAGRYVPEDYTFRSFEKFLYLSLRKLQRNGADHLKGLPESPANPLLCTQSTHRCMHATHAYTGIPCAAYLPKMDHHTIPKIGFTSTQCKPGTGFLPTINTKKAVTLELCHGNDKQVISLPADRLDQNKRYYVTFTVKGNEGSPPEEETKSHRHSKSD